ncbi:amidohydrolase family protein [Hoeflea prorocentri]|uniref:Amidohydrolase family protein n=1 Tax=Hoeflea prorocentri TaxID=1922333 RepID=A0A9X3UI80_9HYPH|nr:amidohydrolase family protein [Hoeflea prorocentri]MCY6381873.1 amidohydrolase family protein [Hoeflea prorocentri]MDA5399673.1 amidohydrolase family protein [Hoeflea prorocentri]
MTTRDIIDAHHHLWSLEGNMYPWLQKPVQIGVGGNVDSIASDYLLSDYREDTKSYNLLASVHIEAHFDRRFPVDETAWLSQMAKESGGPAAIVGYAALEDPNVKEILERHLEHGDCFKGIRQILCNHENPEFCFVQRDDFMRDAQWRKGFGLLAELGLSFDLMVYPHQLPDAIDLAASFPETQIIINHGAMPHDRSKNGLAQWRADLVKLAGYENVSMKVSGLGQTDWNWTGQTIRPMIRDLIEIFGPKRAMFASNFPVDKAYSSFDVLFGAFEKAVEDLSKDEQDALFWGTANRVYRLNAAPA